MSIAMDTQLIRRNGGNFAIVSDADVLGGFRAVSSIAERDAIQSGLRKEGMLVYVIADQTTYQLDANLTSWSTYSGGGGASLPPQTGKEGYTLSTDGASAEWIASLGWFNVLDYGAVPDAVFDVNGILISGTDNTAAFQACFSAAAGGGTVYIPMGVYLIDTNIGGDCPIFVYPDYDPDVQQGLGTGNHAAMRVIGAGSRTVIALKGDYYPIVNFENVFNIGPWGNISFENMTFVGSDADDPDSGPYDAGCIFNVEGQAVNAEFRDMQFFGVKTMNFVGGGNETAHIRCLQGLMLNVYNCIWWGCGAPNFGCIIASYASLNIDNVYFQDYGTWNGHYVSKTPNGAPYLFVAQGTNSNNGFGAPAKRVHTIRNARCDEGVSSTIMFTADPGGEKFHDILIENLQCMPPLSAGGAIVVYNTERGRISGGSIYCRTASGGDPTAVNAQVVIIDSSVTMENVKFDSVNRGPWTGGDGRVQLNSIFGIPWLQLEDCSPKQITSVGAPSQALYNETLKGLKTMPRFTTAWRDLNLSSSAGITAMYGHVDPVGVFFWNLTTTKVNIWTGSAWVHADGSAA